MVFTLYLIVAALFGVAAFLAVKFSEWLEYRALFKAKRAYLEREGAHLEGFFEWLTSTR